MQGGAANPVKGRAPICRLVDSPAEKVWGGSHTRAPRFALATRSLVMQCSARYLPPA